MSKTGLTMKRTSNHLINEKSPYLLQHAYNPVDWYPWTEEAFAKAKKETKPIFLSIGYSTCHWCHVMERESFEDDEIAELLNEKFVAIKVDREERPDIDSIYMSVCTIMTGTGGWPLTIMMTPDGKPFFAATYLPKENRFGRAGLLDVLRNIAEVWESDRQKLTEPAEKIAEYFLDHSRVETAGEELTIDVLDEAFIGLLDSFDLIEGGFRTRPKFPAPHNLIFLLRYWKRKGTPKALEMVEKTLQKMRLGGIYDHVGFGFHRYSTDSSWRVPHFEKMLYDQAMICLAYIEVYEATKKKEYQRTAEEILQYIKRVMTNPEGGFHSAEDADSEGEEGKFYLWTDSEIKGKLGDSAELVEKTFNLSTAGNYTDDINQTRTGKNILYMKKTLDNLAAEQGETIDEFLNRLEKARQLLFQIREKRFHPGKDDKILTDWNGLMIGAYARAAQAFSQTEYLREASRAADFVLKNLQTAEGRLLHRFRDGKASVCGNLDDYSFFIFGLIELYEATFSTKFLREAIRLQKVMIDHFWDKETGGFFFTADDSEKLLTRAKEIRDGALPSGNSMGLLNLVRLARLIGNQEFEEQALKMTRAFSSEIAAAPLFSTMFLVALDFQIGPSLEIVLVGDLEAQETREMLGVLKEEYVPNKAVLLKSDNDLDIVGLVNFVKDMRMIEEKATAYVCKSFVCASPTTSKDRLRTMIKEESRP